MEILYTPHFKREAKNLPISLRLLIEKRLEQFVTDPHEASLKTHKLSGSLKDFWSFSINPRIRVIFEFRNRNQAIFHSIGDHSIYD